MALRQTDPLLRWLYHLAHAQHHDLLPDSELLRRFATEHDQAAFAALVRRHGPMVLRVCRHVLRQEQDAEDCFQAVFLTLAKQAASPRWQESIGNWLYGVAYRLALKARAAAQRPQTCQCQAEAKQAADPAEQMSLRDAQLALDEELVRLPDRLRLPVVLYYLEGRTNEQVARQLKWSPRTLRRRLREARELLRLRLQRRGVLLSTTLLLAGLAEDVAAAEVSALLVMTTVRAAACFVASRGIIGASLPSSSAALAERVVGTLGAVKVKIVAMLLGMALCVAGGSALVYQALAGKTAEPSPPAEDSQGAIAALGQPGPSTEAVRLDRLGEPLPAGALTRLGTASLYHRGVNSVAFSPDGKIIASGGRSEGAVHLREAATGKLIRTLGEQPRPPARNENICVVFSPDGKTLASGGMDGLMRLWEVPTGKELRTLQGHKEGILALAFSPDGKLLASGGNDAMARLWETTTGKEIHSLQGHKNYVSAVAFSPDGKTVATGGPWDKTRRESSIVRLWEAATGKEIRTLRGDQGHAWSVAFSPDGKTLATGGGDGTVYLWATATSKPIRTLQGHQGNVRITFSSDGKILATGADDGVVHLWTVATGKEIRTLREHPKGGIGSVAFSPDGKTVAVGGWSGAVRLWEMATGKLIRSWRRHEESVFAVSFVPDSKVVVTGGMDGTVRLWDAATGNPIRILQGQEDVTFSVAFSPDGKIVAVGSENETVHLWEMATGKPIHILQGHQGLVLAVAFSPDGKTVATGGTDGTVHLWQAATGKKVLTLRGHQRAILLVAFSSDGKTVATVGKDQTIHLWEAASGKGIATLQTISMRSSVIAFSPDGKTLASLGKEKETVHLWEAATGKSIRILHNSQKDGCRIDSVAFSPDGKTVATGVWDRASRNMARVQLWQTATGTLSRTLRVRSEERIAILSTITFSPDGRTLAAACGKWIHLWDLLSGEALPPLIGHLDEVLGITFSSDGTALASASTDTTSLIWDLTYGATRPATQPAPDALRVLWDDLASTDAVRARRAICTLRATPTPSVTLLRDRLRPVPSSMSKRLAQLIADLDADEFTVRERARRGLEEMGPDAESAMRKGLEGRPSLEVRRRLEQLLEPLVGQKKRTYPGGFLRDLRAVAVLERIGTPEARAVLKTLADGGAGFRLTEEAQASLHRLEEARRRGGSKQAAQQR